MTPPARPSGPDEPRISLVKGPAAPPVSLQKGTPAGPPPVSLDKPTAAMPVPAPPAAPGWPPPPPPSGWPPPPPPSAWPPPPAAAWPPPPPGPGWQPPPPAGPPPGGSGGRRAALIAAAGVVALLLVAGGGAVLLGGDGDQPSGPSTPAAVEAPPEPPVVEEPFPEEEPFPDEEPEAVPQRLTPVSVVATAERPGVDLRCTGSFVSYDAAQLVDGDLATGWGAGDDDGTGQSVTIRFDGPVRLSSVGLTPGYVKSGPRQSLDCATASAFDYNRWVPLVEYAFDDGTSVVQSLQRRPEVQTMPVDVVTSSVVLTILETVLPPGADDDTILSEAVFEGTQP